MNPLARAPLAAILIAGAALAHGSGDHPATPMESGQTQERLRPPNIPVTDSRGRTEGFVNRYGDAGPVLISFIYTECDDTCGMIRGVMQLVDQDLQAPGAPDLRLVLISVDPWRDTPEVLAEQARQMEASANWDWLVASTADTPVLLSALGLQSGPIEAHEAVYLLGDVASGTFLRISGVPDPDMLIQHARDIDPG